MPENCLHCGVELEEGEEYLCDECYDKEMRKEIEEMKKLREEEVEAEGADRDESWRFRDSRGRSVFKR